MLAFLSLVITFYACISRKKFTILSAPILLIGSIGLYSTICGILLHELRIWVLIVASIVVLAYATALTAMTESYVNAKYSKSAYVALKIHCVISERFLACCCICAEICG